jgi:hypothetical protein
MILGYQHPLCRWLLAVDGVLLLVGFLLSWLLTQRLHLNCHNCWQIVNRLTNLDTEQGQYTQRRIDQH